MLLLFAFYFFSSGGSPRFSLNKDSGCISTFVLGQHWTEREVAPKLSSVSLSFPKGGSSATAFRGPTTKLVIAILNSMGLLYKFLVLGVRPCSREGCRAAWPKEVFAWVWQPSCLNAELAVMSAPPISAFRLCLSVLLNRIWIRRNESLRWWKCCRVWL